MSAARRLLAPVAWRAVRARDAFGCPGFLILDSSSTARRAIRTTRIATSPLPQEAPAVLERSTTTFDGSMAPSAIWATSIL